MCKVSVVFPLFCPTPVHTKYYFKYKNYILHIFSRQKMRWVKSGECAPF
jgi:hypothetical protein